MIGWGISHLNDVGKILLILDFGAIIILSSIVATINYAIIKKIKSLKDL